MLARCVRSLVKTKVARGYAKVSWKTVLDSEARTKTRVLASEQRIEDSLKGLKEAIQSLDVGVKNDIAQLKKDVVQANKVAEDKLPELIKVAVQANNKDMVWKGVYGSGAFLGGLSLLWATISADLCAQ
jgi:hypothetical protein